MLLERPASQLLVVDVQEKLLPALDHAGPLVEGCRRLMAAAAVLDVPVWLSEHYVKGLGSTVAGLRALVTSANIYDKISFSCLGEPRIVARLAADSRPQVVICGAETHICVLQTAMDLLADGRQVFVVADAVSSREAVAKALALDRLRGAGAEIVTVEMVIFEWLRRAGTPEFKELSSLVRKLANEAAMSTSGDMQRSPGGK